MVHPAAPPITLLYLDFPGLGARWEDDTKDTAARLFRAHDRFAEAVAAHGGQLVPALVDARCACFASPLAAVDAALTFRCRALNEGGLPWCLALASGIGDTEAAIPVPFLHRVRELAESGGRHQVLLASSTAELVAQDLPDDIQLVALGVWRFSDMAAEPVFRLLVPGPPDLTCSRQAPSDVTPSGEVGLGASRSSGSRS